MTNLRHQQVILLVATLCALAIGMLSVMSVQAQDVTLVATLEPGTLEPATVVPTNPFTVTVTAPAPIEPRVIPPVIDTTPEVAVLPATLERLSWGAIVAGTIIVLILMFLFNLIGLAIGMTSINPASGDSPEAGALASRSLIWIIVSNLLALFIGGWFAGYLAGIPSNTDGLLHGILTWGVSGIITVIFVVSGIGRLVNGLSHLIGSTLNLAGNVTGTVAQGAANVVGGVASGAGSLATNALSVLARGVQETAAVTAHGLSNLTDSALENAPEVRDAIDLQNLTRQDIEFQARRLMERAGINADGVQAQVEGAMQDAREIADGAVQDVKDAAQQAMRDPSHAGQYLSLAVQRVFRRGENAIDQVDRDALIDTLTENSGRSREEIAAQVTQWEEQFSRTREQMTQARDRAMQRAEELRAKAEERAQSLFEQAQQRAAEMQREAEMRLTEMREEAERIARETTQSAAKGLAAAAGALALSMVLGAAAAGIGGLIGAPEQIPSAEVEERTSLTIPGVARLENEIAVLSLDVE